MDKDRKELLEKLYFEEVSKREQVYILLSQIVFGVTGLTVAFFAFQMLVNQAIGTEPLLLFGESMKILGKAINQRVLVIIIPIFLLIINYKTRKYLKKRWNQTCYTLIQIIKLQYVLGLLQDAPEEEKECWPKPFQKESGYLEERFFRSIKKFNKYKNVEEWKRNEYNKSKINPVRLWIFIIDCDIAISLTAFIMQILISF